MNREQTVETSIRTSILEIAIVIEVFPQDDLEMGSYTHDYYQGVSPQELEQEDRGAQRKVADACSLRFNEGAGFYHNFVPHVLTRSHRLKDIDTGS